MDQEGDWRPKFVELGTSVLRMLTWWLLLLSRDEPEMEEFSRFLDLIPKNSNQTIILGRDFNLPDIDWENSLIFCLAWVKVP